MDRVPHASAVGHEKRFLLITEWGAGFWSDVKHVLGSTLLSEMTHRIPVVQWGANSLFSRHGDLNAWTRYFEPLSDAEVSGQTYFPPPWDQKLINSHRLIRETRKFGTYGISLLSRQEEVVVSDTHISVQDLVPWLDEASSPYAGMSAWQATRALARKYLMLNGRTRGLVEASRRRLLAGREKWLAVHVRGTDKRTEVKHLDEINASYPERIDAFLKDNPGFGVFLLTDSIEHLEQMQSRYGERLIATDATRSQMHGVHYSGHDPVRIADEAIVDTYLAAGCDAFIGNGTSNVSLAVAFLKEWPEGAITLLGPDLREHRHTL